MEFVAYGKNIVGKRYNNTQTTDSGIIIPDAGLMDGVKTFDKYIEVTSVGKDVEGDIKKGDILVTRAGVEVDMMWIVHEESVVAIHRRK